jgi:putative restriction endonuclease
MADAVDTAIRLAAFAFLDDQVLVHGEVLPRSVLQDGFSFRGQRVPLVGPQGIFKPAVLSGAPLSITTVPFVEGRARPYDDEIGVDGFLRYRYRGTDPAHHQNVGLRRAMTERLPLVYLWGVAPGRYLPVYPVLIVGDDPSALSFTIAVPDPAALGQSGPPHEADIAWRQYVTRLTRQRLHQAGFRERVLAAYRTTCAICRLRHRELLDAAHILPDTHPRGEPIVPNGLALCKLHHAAFDSNILGVRPDLIVEIRLDVLQEVDGPMLRHGLQESHGLKLMVPRAGPLRPNAEFLAERYEDFRRTG